MSVKDVVEYPYIITGAGATEAFLCHKLREWVNRLNGREQLSAEKFIEALESIPLTLAENAGMDPKIVKFNYILKPQRVISQSME
jgi:archaeal chaperonin